MIRLRKLRALIAPGHFLTTSEFKRKRRLIKRFFYLENGITELMAIILSLAASLTGLLVGFVPVFIYGVDKALISSVHYFKGLTI